MKSDTATRALLVLILLCLVILIVRGCRDGEPAASPQAAAPEEPAEAANAAPRPGAAPSAVPMPPPTQAEIQILIEALGRDELPPEVRAWTAQQLGAMEGEEAAAALRAALEDSEPEVAAAAAAALSKRGEPGVAASPETARSPSGAGEAPAPGLRIETLD
jgi:2-oxoglutarate dehydrogenase E2 component (dihydrolipoamide succinyltransferase)